MPGYKSGYVLAQNIPYARAFLTTIRVRWHKKYFPDLVLGTHIEGLGYPDYIERYFENEMCVLLCVQQGY